MEHSSRVDLTVATDPPSRLYIAPDLADSLHVTNSASEERLHFGLRSHPVTVIRSATMAPGCAELTEAGLSALSVPQPARLHIFRTGRTDLRLGPLIGVLISEEKLADLRDGAEDSIYIRYTRYAEEIGAYLVFMTRDGIRADHNVAHAHRYRNGQLRSVQVPLPRVIYDRCFGQNARASAHWARTLAVEKGITVINKPVSLTKYATYETIGGDPSLSHIVPFFTRLTPENLRDALGRFNVLYLKPDNLSKGKGVCRVHRERKSWVLEETGDNNLTRLAFRSPEALVHYLPTDNPYLIQEALDLADYMGNRYDFRALVQKDGSGEWKLTGLVARIAPRNGVVTSPRSGGLVAPALTALEHTFGKNGGRQVLYDLTRTSLRIAMRLEKVYGLCAELGLDIGVTRDGHIRLIEANGRPLKVSLARLNDPAIHGPIIRQPINFAASLDLKSNATEKA